MYKQINKFKKIQNKNTAKAQTKKFPHSTKLLKFALEKSATTTFQF